jgi:molybdate transport system substrate-binding protein
VAIGYPIARTSAGSDAAEARRFIAYVLSPAGQAVLAKYGFQQP